MLDTHCIIVPHSSPKCPLNFSLFTENNIYCFLTGSVGCILYSEPTEDSIWELPVYEVGDQRRYTRPKVGGLA